MLKNYNIKALLPQNFNLYTGGHSEIVWFCTIFDLKISIYKHKAFTKKVSELLKPSAKPGFLNSSCLKLQYLELLA